VYIFNDLADIVSLVLIGKGFDYSSLVMISILSSAAAMSLLSDKQMTKLSCYKFETFGLIIQIDFIKLKRDMSNDNN